ncbi:hypothetical protein AWE51_03690 [Aquimarina aggregata]|uniref:Uncharacterized protein n=1 Tax=Aquimarina aggregata TaxID=1642818 RepID=A0A163CM53_9FLAO|nr:hypothetical protein [Aquimarina aggregata]KZS42556.1 hypothetical protein AWE51_03690 [Aquimarina aggregata]
MSGEAGAGISSKYFKMYFSSGMTVSVAMPPDLEDHPNYIEDYFKEASKPFETKLKDVLPRVDQSFETLIQQHGFPISLYDPKAVFVADAIIEDVDLGHENKSTRNLLVSSGADVNLSFFTRSFSKINLSITINKQIKRSELNTIRAQIIEIFD